MVEKVTIKELDPDRIEKDDSFPRAYAFYIVLTATPDPIWVEFFVSHYEIKPYPLEKEVTIHGSQIRVVTASGEEEEHVRFVRELVDETNKAVDDYNKAAAEAEVRDRGTKQQEDAEAQQIRERLKKIRIA